MVPCPYPTLCETALARQLHGDDDRQGHDEQLIQAPDDGNPLRNQVEPQQHLAEGNAREWLAQPRRPGLFQDKPVDMESAFGRLRIDRKRGSH